LSRQDGAVTIEVIYSSLWAACVRPTTTGSIQVVLNKSSASGGLLDGGDQVPQKGGKTMSKLVAPVQTVAF